ncbi:hypothetical protein [Orbus mooreae]|uniref:hypothetical protein n=1 Tax=Orbus mooreae TaxID=3074107 RepID=UPI00370DCE47
MDLFWGIFFSFPVIIFSTLLTLCILYWLIAACGILSIDCLDINLDADIDGITPDLPNNSLGGLLMKFGFNQVPMTLIITLISLLGWAISYLFCRYFLVYLYDFSLFYYIAGTIAFFVIFIASTFLTAWLIRPLRPFFSKLNGGNNHRTLLGQVVVIRSSIVNEVKGEAYYEDGGAGLILKVIADEKYQFKRGDKAVLLRYDNASNQYEIISIEEFHGHKNLTSFGEK